MKNKLILSTFSFSLVLGTLISSAILIEPKIKNSIETKIDNSREDLKFTYRPVLEGSGIDPFQGKYREDGEKQTIDFELSDQVDYWILEDEPGTQIANDENEFDASSGQWRGRHSGMTCNRDDDYGIDLTEMESNGTFRQMQFVGEGWCAPNAPTWYESYIRYNYEGFENNTITYDFSLDYKEDKAEGGYSFPHEDFINGDYDPNNTGSEVEIKYWESAVEFEGYYSDSFSLDWNWINWDNNYIQNFVYKNTPFYNVQETSYETIEDMIISSNFPIEDINGDILGLPVTGTEIDFISGSGEQITDKEDLINYNTVWYRFVSNGENENVTGESDWQILNFPIIESEFDFYYHNRLINPDTGELIENLEDYLIDLNDPEELNEFGQTPFVEWNFNDDSWILNSNVPAVFTIESENNDFIKSINGEDLDNTEIFEIVFNTDRIDWNDNEENFQKIEIEYYSGHIVSYDLNLLMSPAALTEQEISIYALDEDGTGTTNAERIEYVYDRNPFDGLDLKSYSDVNVFNSSNSSDAAIIKYDWKNSVIDDYNLIDTFKVYDFNPDTWVADEESEIKLRRGESITLENDDFKYIEVIDIAGNVYNQIVEVDHSLPTNTTSLNLLTEDEDYQSFIFDVMKSELYVPFFERSYINKASTFNRLYTRP